MSGDIAELPEGSPDIQVISPLYNVPREVLIAAEPDLVIFTAEFQMSGEDGTATFDDLAQAGINPYVLQGNCNEPAEGTTVDTVYADIANLGSILGVVDEATTLVEELREPA